MDNIKNINDLLKMQSDAFAQLDKLIQTLRTPESETVLALKADIANRAQSALDQAFKGRDTAMAYWDNRIEKLKTEADRQANELQALKAKLTEVKDLPDSNNSRDV